MNSRQENRSKLSLTARIITKYSLERFLSIWGEKMSKGFLKFCKIRPSSFFLRLASSDRRLFELEKSFYKFCEEEIKNTSWKEWEDGIYSRIDESEIERVRAAKVSEISDIKTTSA